METRIPIEILDNSHVVTTDNIDSVIDDFNGSTDKASGKRGFVPAPTAEDRNDFLKGDGTWSSAAIVTQNVSSNNADYPILLTPTANASSDQGDKTAIFASGVKVNPSTGTVSATSFSGQLSGTAETASKLASSFTIELTGDASGSASTDGSSSAVINVTIDDDSHNHVVANIDGLQDILDGKASGTHSHGSITSDGHVGSTANLPLITGTGGAVEAGSFGTTAGTFCEGNDSRLSDARTPTSHTHGNISNDGKLAGTSKVVVTDAEGAITSSTSVTSSELEYVHGVTSSIQTQIDNKAPSSHTHSTSDITSGVFPSSAIPDLDASKITSGTIDIARLPAGALERMVVVADDDARFALTASDVQAGDTVKQADTGVMYYVKDASNLDSEDGYEEYTAGSATSVPWSGVTDKPESFTPSSHTHASSDVTLMTGYSKPVSTSAITASDTLNSAVGKLEKALDEKASTSHASSATTYGVSSDSNYGHAKASSTTPKAPAITASLGTETATFARGDHVHPMQNAVTAVSASFECREETVQLPLAFYVHLCEYWDDGESDGCYSQDSGNDPVNFSFISGVETKIATLQAIPEVSDTYYTLVIEIGDVSYNDRSDRSDERNASDDTLYYCSAGSSVGSQYIQVGESQDITFAALHRVYRNSGEAWRRNEITPISSTSVTIDSDLFGQYTVSARIVREPNGPNGEYVISVYATAVSTEESSGTKPIFSLTSTGADGISTTQEVDMSGIGDENIHTLSTEFSCETNEISPAVDEPAVLYATRAVFLDQAGYEAFEAGNRPSNSNREYAVSGGWLSHDSASFTTLVPSGIQNPYAIALSTGTDENASGYNLKPVTIMDWPYGGAVKVSDLLASGETGVKLAFLGSDFEPYGDGTLDVYASFSASQDGSYTVSYSARKDAVTEDVLTARIDGKDGSGETVSSVDVSPLLNYIGGRVEEVHSQEQVPLTDVRGLNSSDAVFPVYWNDLFSREGNVFFDAVGDAIAVVSYSVSDGSETFVLASGSSPAYFYPYYIRSDSISFSPIYYYFVPEFEGSIDRVKVSLDDLLSGPVELQEYMAAYQQSVPSPTGNTATLVMEAVEGDAPAYSFTLYSGSGETKKVLRLYPSCDGDIDLSGLIPDVTDYQGATSSASGVAGLVPAATSAQKDNYLKGDGTWSELTLPSNYQGATSSASGVAGLVPAAESAEKDSFLVGDGTWKNIGGTVEEVVDVDSLESVPLYSTMKTSVSIPSYFTYAITLSLDGGSTYNNGTRQSSSTEGDYVDVSFYGVGGTVNPTTAFINPYLGVVTSVYDDYPAYYITTQTSQESYEYLSDFYSAGEAGLPLYSYSNANPGVLAETDLRLSVELVSENQDSRYVVRLRLVKAGEKKKVLNLYPSSSSGIDLSDLNPDIPVYQGATSSASGVAGLVPAATSAQKDNFLKGDGTWATVEVNSPTGVSAGSYGPSTDASPTYSGTFTVPQITVDANGRITAASDKTITLPASDDTNNKVTQTVSTDNTELPLLAKTSNATTTVTDTSKFAAAVTLNPSTGTVTATKFSGAVSGNADSATEFSAAKSVTLTGDVTGTASSKAGWSVATTLSNSGATAGSYGLSANATPGYGETFNVPYVTIDAKGRVTSASTKTVTIPASDNTDTKVTQTVSTDNTDLPILAKSSNATTTVTDTSKFAAAVTINPSTGTLTATKFSGAVTGNADSATEFASNQSVTLTGDVTGTASSKAGWSVATTLSNSGVTANSYGPSANASPSFSGTFTVPYITVDAKGRITSAADKTITLPASDNTDTKVSQVVSTENAELPILAKYSDGTTTVTGGSKFSADVKINPSTGTVTATKFAGDVTNGTLGTASGVVVTDANKKLTVSSVTSTELGYVSGVTSSIQTQLNGKASSSHEHAAGDITSGTLDTARIPNLDASKITSGTISIDRLPSGALERLVVVADQTARFALTTANVQLGDTVKQTDTGVMYYVKDVSNLDSAAGYEEYSAGTATSVPWSGVTSKPESFTPASHNHPSSEINLMTGYSKPSSTSAIGTSDTLNSAVGKLEKALDGKAPTSHASSATTYGVSSASNYGHAKASSTTPKAPASTASVGSETSSFARGDHVHPMQKAVTGVSGSCSPNTVRHIVDENVTFELPTLSGYAFVSSVSAGLQSEQLQLAVKEPDAPITNLQEDFLTSGIIYWSDSFNIIENIDLDYYINDPSQFSDITVDSIEDLYLETGSYFNIMFDTSTATGTDLRPYPVAPTINENLTGVRMVENLYITIPPQVGETITFKNVPVLIETDYYQYSNDSNATAEDLEFFEKYIGSFDFFLERQSTTNFRTGFRWNAPGGATVELTATNSDNTTDTSSFIIPEYHGASTTIDGGSGLVPAAKSSERNYYLKGDGTWGQVEIPQISNYTGATSSANGAAGLVPPATSAQRENFLKGDGTWATVSTAKEVSYVTSAPTSGTVSSLDNESIIFYEESTGSSPAIPVTTTGNQSITGIKTFVNGVYGGVVTLASNESAFDLTRATCFVKTITANTTFSFTNVPNNVVCCITVVLINGGNYVVTWPASTKWTGNETPVLTQNGKDVLTFITPDGGTTWFGTTTCIGVTS